MNWGFSPFPDCSICKRWADDGGWLDNVNYRFWVCLDCDDFLDEIERDVMTDTQFEAILYAMFTCENEIDHLDNMLVATGNKTTTKFLETQKAKRKNHLEALKELLRNNKRHYEIDPHNQIKDY